MQNESNLRNEPTAYAGMCRRKVMRTLLALSAAALLPVSIHRSGAAKAASAHAKGLYADVHSALIIVDVQNCFLPGGSLAVPQGDEIIPVINRLAGLFSIVVATQDWHTAGHVSFASSHAGAKPYSSISLPYGTQVLWPDHCIMGTQDSQLAASLDSAKAQLVIRKGFHQGIDSYSAFLEADHRTATGLEGYLKERQVKRVFVCGLATDFCVAWTALDARKAGFQSAVIEDACRGIDLNGSLQSAWTRMQTAGVSRVRAADFGA